MSMTDAYVGLGSNLDDPEEQLRRAIAALQQVSGTTLTGTSSFYRTRPLGPENQPDYINAVTRLRTGLTAGELLKQLQAIEARQGRIRNTRWGPRTLDLDLLLYGNEIINEDHLQVPHPEMHRRGFVLYPLHEIAADISIPGHGPVAELLKTVSPDQVQKLARS
jgi:2-amino-4-hydroxy-6-hydroxymethyldihydropteridine diphosphokinase